MTTKRDHPITLHMEGDRAVAGVALGDFEDFIDGFLDALRDFERSRRGAPTKKSGHPEAAAKAATAFRLVGFREGSGIATIVPDVDAITEESDTEPMFTGEPPQVENLRELVKAVEEERPLPQPVVESLDKARRTFGSDGLIRVDVPGEADSSNGELSVTIDAKRIERIEAAIEEEPRSEVTTVSGRLHEIDVEPDKLAIRAADGTDWASKYPEHLEPQVEQMVNKIVWASGTGSLTASRRGRFEIEAIRLADPGEQTAFFTEEPTPERVLEEQQGIRAPQHLQDLGDLGLDPDEDADFLAALTHD